MTEYTTVSIESLGSNGEGKHGELFSALLALSPGDALVVSPQLNSQGNVYRSLVSRAKTISKRLRSKKIGDSSTALWLVDRA